MKDEKKQIQQKVMQLDDIALELGLSKSTVSRAISGKGRIGKETSQRVREYIEKHGYRPNMIARSFAQSKTYNIGVVLPSDAFQSEIPFFQNCLMGVCEKAAHYDYDVVVTTVSENDLFFLKRIVSSRKVDGIILTRSLVTDEPAEFLNQAGLPFVMVGSSKDASIVQVDTDHTAACREMTERLLQKGFGRFALLTGNSHYMVNRSRIEGFRQAISMSAAQTVCDERDLVNRPSIQAAVQKALQCGADCIVCGDDYICNRALACLHEKGIIIPRDIKVASFYNSILLDMHKPPVTAVDIDAKALGAAACDRLMDMLGGVEADRIRLLNYEILMKETTND